MKQSKLDDHNQIMISKQFCTVIIILKNKGGQRFMRWMTWVKDTIFAINCMPNYNLLTCSDLFSELFRELERSKLNVAAIFLRQKKLIRKCSLI